MGQPRYRSVKQQIEESVDEAALYTTAELAELLGLHRVSLWRLARRKKSFPQPIKISPTATRWRRRDVLRWLKEREQNS